MLSLSIVIPVFNEAKRLDNTFVALESLLSDFKFSNLEVIFVDDGSEDETMMRIQNFVKKYPLARLIVYKPNRGKGYAVRRGMLAAKNNYILMLDADMSTSFSELEKFIPYMERDCPVIIGSRKKEGAVINKAQPWLRQKMGLGYTFLANLILGVGIRDFTCGFKCFSYNAAQNIFSRAKVNRWSYDAEVLYLAKKLNLEIYEVPVVWHDDERTRVRLLRDVLVSFRDLLKIRLLHRSL
jgi:dolichyl-phosphate beta-glucosyltransferase